MCTPLKKNFIKDFSKIIGIGEEIAQPSDCCNLTKILGGDTSYHSKAHDLCYIFKGNPPLDSTGGPNMTAFKDVPPSTGTCSGTKEPKKDITGGTIEKIIQKVSTVDKCCEIAQLFGIKSAAYRTAPKAGPLCVLYSNDTPVTVGDAGPKFTVITSVPGPSPGPPAPAPTVPIKCESGAWKIFDKDGKEVCNGNKACTAVSRPSSYTNQQNLCLYASQHTKDFTVTSNTKNFDPKTGVAQCVIKDAGANCSALTVLKAWCLASTTKIPKLVNNNVQHVEVKDLKDGDMIRTTRGAFPLSHIMHTTTIGPHTYVKVDQGSLGNNLPSQDLYLTHEHSFSLGYYKNSVLNRNIHDPDQDDMVYLHITADQLADKLPGITRVQKEFDAMFNLVFDEHVSLDIYGLEVMMHHPKGNPYTLPEEKYQDKTKINNKVQKPLFANYGMLENIKPDHMEMKDFLRNCITANLDDKFSLEDVNHPSFAPQKTMLTEDLRKKLRVN